jgi:hypothetical protein
VVFAILAWVLDTQNKIFSTIASISLSLNIVRKSTTVNFLIACLSKRFELVKKTKQRKEEALAKRHRFVSVLTQFSLRTSVFTVLGGIPENGTGQSSK